MSLSVGQGNETIPVAHIHALTSLISIVSTHFLVKSFHVITDLEFTSILNFQKIASNYYFEIQFDNSIEQDSPADLEKGYIILQKNGFDFLEIMKNRPKLIMAIFITDKKKLKPSEYYPGIIPPSTSFFLVFMSKYPTGFTSPENSVRVQGKCFRLYKPASNFTTIIFPLMFYGGQNESKWHWQNNRTDWNSHARDILNMSEVTVTIALATSREKNSAVTAFLKSKNSFFWRSMADFLKFRAVVHVERISPQAVKNMTSVYLRLLMTIADGLGVLPVMSSDRNHQSLKFLVTGLDSKYHLFVRSPQYVHSWQSTLKPFAAESWLCLGLAILLISVTLKIVTRGEKSEDTNISRCFLIVFGFICSQGSPSVPKDVAARFVCYTALLLSIIICQFYTSNFCSLLSTKEVRLPFTSLEQLIAKGTHSLYIHPDTAIYTHILKAKSGVFKKLFDKILKKDPFHQLVQSNREKAFSKICGKGTGAILGLPFQILYLNEMSCALIPVNSGYFPASVGTAIRRSFPFQRQFKFVHLRLLESGVTHKFRDEFFNFSQQRATKTDVINEPVSMNHVAFLFAFYAAFLFFSSVMCGLEIIFFKRSKNTDKYSSGGNLILRRKHNLVDLP